MKIAMATRHYWTIGGIGRCVAGIAEQFAQKDEVHVFADSWPNPHPKVHYHKLRTIAKPLALNVLTFAINSQRSIDRKAFDITHCPIVDSLAQDVFTAHSCHKAVVAQFKRERGLGYSILKSFEPLSNIVLRIERHNYKPRNYMRIIAISEKIKEEITKHYHVPAGDITVIPNGVDTSVFKPDARKREGIRRKHGLTDKTVLMFSGWEFKRKGLEFVVRSLPFVKDKETVLMVVGKNDPSPYQAIARQLGVADRVLFTGFVDDIAAYYNAADAYVFPTSYEAFGLVITEAMACGVPVITTKDAGAAELITDGKDGLLLDSAFNPDEIAQKLNTLLESGKARRQMGENARKTAVRYDWAEIAARTRHVYEEVRKS